MLQECNKFREHQAREVLIDLLERQLTKRQQVIQDPGQQIDKANDLLLLGSAEPQPMDTD